MSEMEEFLGVSREAWRNWLKKNHKKKKGVWLVKYKKHTKKESVSYDDSVEEAICFGWIDSTVKRIDDEKYKQKFTPRRKKGSNYSRLNCQRARRMIDDGLMEEKGLKEYNKWIEDHPEDAISSEEEEEDDDEEEEYDEDEDDDEDEDEDYIPNKTGRKRKAEKHDLNSKTRGKKSKKRKKVHSYIGRKRKKIVFTESDVPDDLKKALKKSRVFSKFINTYAPYAKRAYVKHVNSCKREDTRIRRIQKVVNIVKQKKGIEDLYKPAQNCIE